MTNGVKQALALPLLVGSNADKQTRQKAAAGNGFSDALRSAKIGKPDGAGKPDAPGKPDAASNPDVVGKPDVAGKPAADAAPRWVRFSTKLDAVIGRTGNIAERPEKPAIAFAVAIRSDEQDSPDADDLADFEDAADEDPVVAAGTSAPSAMPGLHFPPLLARRVAGNDEGQSRPGHEPAGDDTADARALSGTDADDGESDNRASGAGRSADPGPRHVAARPAAALTADAVAAPGIADRPAKPAVDKGPVHVAARPAAAPMTDVAAAPGIANPPATPAADKTETPADAPEPKHSDMPKIARATILSEQSFPAPVPATAVALAEVIVSDGTFLAATDRSVLQTQQIHNAVASAHSLKIQLHPAELGIVTASLRFVGEQLSIKLKVESSEAYQRLSADSEAIVKSLRRLGYEIDRVTVIQPSIAVNAPVRLDANASIPGQAPRGGEPFGSGATGGGNGGTGGQRPGGDGNDARDNGQRTVAGQSDRAGSGLYI